MRTLRFAVPAALLMTITFFAPSIAAEPVAVSACSRECTPEEVNGNLVKTGKEVTNVILYGHFHDALNQAPINTQPPDEIREPDLNAAFLTPVVDTNTGQCPNDTCADFHFKPNQFTMFSSPGLVSFLSDGEWYTHQEPGLAGPAKIVGDELHLYWYLSAHALPGQKSTSGTGAVATLGAMPQVGIYARLETGRHPYHGTVIAESADFDENPLGSTERANMVTVPGQPEVYEFLVKMKVKEHVIPDSEAADGFVVFVQPYQIKTDKGEKKGVQFAQEEWRFRTGPRYPNRLVLPIEEPMQTAAGTLSVFDGRLFVRWSFLSVWGSYDMRDNELKLTSTGPTAIDPKAIEFIILKRSVDHDGHFKPVNATWALDLAEHPLADGDYEVTASIPNLAGTYLLAHKFNFKVVDGRPDVPVIGAPSAAGQGKSAPGGGVGGNAPAPALSLVLVAVAALALVRGRRQG